MNVEIGAEAWLFPEKEYISGIFVAVQYTSFKSVTESVLEQLTNSLIFINLLGAVS